MILTPTFSAKTLLQMLHDINGQLDSFYGDPTWPFRERVEAMRKDIIEAIHETIAVTIY